MCITLVSGGRILRNAFFAWIMRAIYNFLTDPVTTLPELLNINYKDQVERITSSNFLTTFLGRFLFEAFCISIGKDIFYFKILPLDGKHLKVRLFGLYSNPNVNL